MNGTRRRHNHNLRPSLIHESTGTKLLPESLRVFWKIIPLKSDPETLRRTGILGKLELGLLSQKDNIICNWRFFLRLRSTISAFKDARKRLIFSIEDAVILSTSKFPEVDFIYPDSSRSYHYMDLTDPASSTVLFNILAIFAKIRQQTKRFNAQRLLHPNYDGANQPPNQGIVFLTPEELGTVPITD